MKTVLNQGLATWRIVDHRYWKFLLRTNCESRKPDWRSRRVDEDGLIVIAHVVGLVGNQARAKVPPMRAWMAFQAEVP